MALPDCPRCWNTPCDCGHMFQDWSIKDLEKHIKVLQKVLGAKRKASQTPAERAAKELSQNRVDHGVYE